MIFRHNELIQAYKSYQLGKLNDVLYELRKFEEKPEKSKDLNIEIAILRAIILLDFGEVKEAQDLLEKVKKDALKYQKKEYLAAVNALLSTIFLRQGSLVQATEKIIEAQEITDSLSSSRKEEYLQLISFIDNVFGLIYQSQGNLEEALKYYNNSLKGSKKTAVVKDNGQTHYNIGVVLAAIGKNDIAFEHLQIAKSQFEKISYYEGLFAVYATQQQIYESLADSDAAFIVAQKKSELQEKLMLTNQIKEQIKKNFDVVAENALLYEKQMELEDRLWKLEFQLNSAELGQSTSNLNTLTQNLENAVAENMMLQQELTKNKAKANNLANQLNSLQSESSAEELTKFKEMVQKVNKQNQALTQKVENQDFIKKENVALKNKLQQLEAENLQLTSQLNEMGKSTADATEQETLNTKFEQLIAENKTLEEEIQHLKQQYTAQEDELNTKISVLIADKQNSTKHLQESLSTQNLQKTKIAELEATMQELQNATNISANTELMQLHAKIKELEAAKTEQDTAHDQIKKSELQRIQKLEDEIVSKESEIINLQKQLETMRAIRDEKSALQKQLTTQELTNNELQERIAKLQQTIDNLTVENEALQQQFHAQELANDELQHETAKLQKTIEALKDKQSSVATTTTTPSNPPSAGNPPSPQVQLPTNLKRNLEHNKPLDQVLASSKLAEIIYDIMKTQKQLTLRTLSMRIGTSPAKCLDELAEFEKNGYFTIIKSNDGDTNPQIKLK